jgi:hypothetical protein
MSNKSVAVPIMTVAGRAPIEAIRRVPSQKPLRPLASKNNSPRALPSKRV